MPTVHRPDLEASAKVIASGEERYATLHIHVPAYGRTLPVEVHLAHGSISVAARTLQTLGELVDLSVAARQRIRQLLYDDAMRAKASAQFGDPAPPTEEPPSGFLRRLLWRPTKYRFVPLADDDPRHPCNVPGGQDAIETKVEWVGLRIDENDGLKNRFALLDCRPAWEAEHGATVVLRNGVPVAVDDQQADLRRYDDA